MASKLPGGCAEGPALAVGLRQARFRRLRWDRVWVSGWGLGARGSVRVLGGWGLGFATTRSLGVMVFRVVVADVNIASRVE